MKKKSLALAALAAACVTSFAFATPQTQWTQGQWQLDLGAWNPKASMDSNNTYLKDGDLSTDTKWNFQGGLGYGLSDKVALQYNYYGLKTGGNDSTHNVGTDGNEHEVNLVYSLNKNFAVYAGWNRIKNSFDNASFHDNGYEQTNNVAQIGLIAKAPITDNFDFYAKGAVGTQRTTIWEAGLGYTFGDNFDLSAGYRYVNTKLADKDTSKGFTDDANISYKGFIATLSYRFGGGHKAAPAPEPVYEPAPAPQQPTYVAPEKKDYYVESIHFDFDQDQPKATETTKLNHFVQVAKENPNDMFKLVGNTDAKGTNAYNDDLSKRRVENVATYANNNGVPASQMELDYKGKTDPVSTNDTDQGRADNRRVDIWQNK
ncbi:MAG: OmpA family protein [Megasphaera sp.]|jgi:OOP family OmpA-OmpF porin|nr:OmpA family protein [Megasphaera sp.]MCH4187497.1 OmpA family protein [Megasphaera sp.]MCH4217779.1 OmpA family protein [Megasphaera sp.]